MESGLLSVKRVFIGELGVVRPEDGDQVVATNGLVSCIALAGVCKESRVGFLAHFSTPDQVVEFYRRGVSHLKMHASKDEDEDITFEALMVGGWDRAKSSHKIVKLLRDQDSRLEGSGVSLDVEEGELLSSSPSRYNPPPPTSLSVDAITLVFKTYVPQEGHRSLTPSEIEYYNTPESLATLKIV